MPSGGSSDWGQRHQQFIRQLEAIKREHERGTEIYASYIAQVERSLSAAQSAKQSLTGINTEITNAGVATDCQSVNEILARQDSAIREARNVGAAANEHPVNMPE